jgi:hypothetical protein
MGSVESVPGPDAESYVVLDIGGEVGALVLYCPANLDGAEIEISRDDAPRTHSQVRERRIGSAPPIYAAVYPGLSNGVYTIWRDDSTPAGTVRLDGGQVATFHWPASEHSDAEGHAHPGQHAHAGTHAHPGDHGHADQHGHLGDHGHADQHDPGDHGDAG